MRHAAGLCLVVVAWSLAARADEPPQSVQDSSRAARLPEGYTLELVASEPLIANPSSVCWDERGRLYVSELREFGAIKQLRDNDGDGRMDQAELWADQLPPCHGMCPARGGLIVACAPDLLYLADRDGDGRADVREVLYSGFLPLPGPSPINAPQWGQDGFIYVSQGRHRHRITGPRLEKPVDLPPADFRIRADGAAIGPVSGAAQNHGFTWNESGDRFVASTRTLARQVAPLPWSDRFREEEDIEGAARQGDFASACSPLVYQDAVLPELRGQLFVCEPARNIVHRRALRRSGPRYRLDQMSGEEQRPFLVSSDPWFHPISLTHGPDGRLWIVDLCRKRSEDSSPAPRPAGSPSNRDDGLGRGRIWRLTHRDAPSRETQPPADMRSLTAEQLAVEVTSGLWWRRETARRLLVESNARSTMTALSHSVRNATDATGVINALSTLDLLDSLNSELLEETLADTEPAVRRHALRLCQEVLDKRPGLLDVVLGMTGDADARVRLQVALTLGDSRSARVLPALAKIGRANGNDPWVRQAILLSCAGRERELRQVLLESPQALGQAHSLVQALGAE